MLFGIDMGSFWPPILCLYVIYLRGQLLESRGIAWLSGAFLSKIFGLTRSAKNQGALQLPRSLRTLPISAKQVRPGFALASSRFSVIILGLLELYCDLCAGLSWLHLHQVHFPLHRYGHNRYGHTLGISGTKCLFRVLVKSADPKLSLFSNVKATNTLVQITEDPVIVVVVVVYVQPHTSTVSMISTYQST